MKNILIILFCFTIYNNSFAQKIHEDAIQLSGSWVGKVGEHPIKFEILEKTPNSFTFSFINFQNERFTILKSDVTTNEKNEFIIHIKEAKFSSQRYENCIFSTGVVTLSDLSQNSMRLNLKSVGPTCFISYDVLMNMDDIKDIILTKEKSNK
ncbi:hypothetical protein C1637_00820 [Chryseobacterium lactis]|uniref:Lipocalin-like domain-containing protein n=1 Tax=Chryseobacterium lactis TaxID=1241981 RepID=A0A3G6RMN3_CHRLC|nr:hypothetical protein [Chryseobacterium lactis]AZA81154.1 hypothetical protein EG342_04205 [Chryseobacterium lactis]AZB06155.1 hypothetical protein EG341_20330 [Chryseobacterium lactis]PNW15005.1 hypothetical protein C1637_00820 [Chryseobacterium lactis]